MQRDILLERTMAAVCEAESPISGMSIVAKVRETPEYTRLQIRDTVAALCLMRLVRVTEENIEWEMVKYEPTKMGVTWFAPIKLRNDEQFAASIEFLSDPSNGLGLQSKQRLVDATESLKRTRRVTKDKVNIIPA